MTLDPDPLNGPITMSIAESELLRENNQFGFVISGSTSMASELQVLSHGKEVDQMVLAQGDDSSGGTFFKQKNRGDRISLEGLMKPVNEGLIKKVARLESMVDRIKVTHTSSISKKSTKNVDQVSTLQEEFDFASIAL